MYVQLQCKQKRFPDSCFCHFWILKYFSNKITSKSLVFCVSILNRSMASTMPLQIYMKGGVSLLYVKHFPVQKAILQTQRYKLGFFKLFLYFLFSIFFFSFFTFQYSSCISGYANHFYYLYVPCIFLMKFFIFFPPFLSIFNENIFYFWKRKEIWFQFQIEFLTKELS